MSFALENQVQELADEIKELKDALVFYADTHTYLHHPPETFSPIWNDKGEKARKALQFRRYNNASSK